SGLLVDRVDGDVLPRPDFENAAIGMYRCRDGWIFLVGSLPHLHEGTLDVLGCRDDRASVAAATSRWDAVELETTLADRGLCGAAARTVDDWRRSPQGRVVSALPAVELVQIGRADPRQAPEGDLPLSGVRVLEVARILAGPITGRTLASLGADVLNTTTPRLGNFHACVVNAGIGKRHAEVDLATSDGATTYTDLARAAHVVVDAHRAGSLEARGLGPRALTEISPGVVYVSVNAYGQEGPWRERRGFEQMAQVAAGLTTVQGSPEEPEILPIGAPLDYITGFLGAYGAMAGLAAQRRHGGSWWARASLAQSAAWLARLPPVAGFESARGLGGDPGARQKNELERIDDVSAVRPYLQTTISPFGAVEHLRPAFHLDRTPARWDLPPVAPGTHPAAWA
ncbi:MAG: CoA transferase, partial [Acidimicrobiia bacterium]